MEELNIKDLLKFYLNKSPIIIVITLLMFLIGYYYNEYIQLPLYHGTTTIILVQSDEDEDSNITQNEISLNEKLISTYSEIIKSRRVLEKVITKLELKTTPSKLKEQISVNEVSDTSIIEITVSDKDNEQAVLIANRVAKEFGREITAIYNLKNVSVIDEAIIENEPYNVNKTKQMLIFIAGGIVISCAIIFIIYYFDNTIKTKKDIETCLNIPVLGEIPLAPKLLKREKRIKTKKEKVKRRFKLNLKKNSSRKNRKEKLEESVIEETKIVKTSSKNTPTKKSTPKSTAKKSTTKITPKNKTNKETKRSKETTISTKKITKSPSSKTAKKTNATTPTTTKKSSSKSTTSKTVKKSTTPKSKKKDSDK